jgi:hypothetical protein
MSAPRFRSEDGARLSAPAQCAPPIGVGAHRRTGADRASGALGAHSGALGHGATRRARPGTFRTHPDAPGRARSGSATPSHRNGSNRRARLLSRDEPAVVHRAAVARPLVRLVRLPCAPMRRRPRARGARRLTA